METKDTKVDGKPESWLLDDEDTNISGLFHGNFKAEMLHNTNWDKYIKAQCFLHQHIKWPWIFLKAWVKYFRNEWQ